MTGAIAHIAGVPVEETLLMLGPALIVAGGMLTARVRAGLRRPLRPPGTRRAGRSDPRA